MSHTTKLRPELSIIIKTLNEESNIGRCIDAIQSNISGIEYEVIVADSGSTDRTTDIACRYPITVVQLAHSSEKCCGIGPQLGYQHSHGDFILILDADMVLHADFVKKALAEMRSNDDCAGIGGQLIERSGTGYEYDLRKKQATQRTGSKSVQWLDGSGIYRRTAIETIGYLTNRNLHAYEEKELGLRLKKAGWQLLSLADVAVDHYGYSSGSATLLRQRWRSGYAAACGECIKTSIGTPYFIDMVRLHKAPLITLAAIFGFAFSAIAFPWTSWPLKVMGSTIGIAAIVQFVRKGSIKDTTHSLLHLLVFAAGTFKGIFRSQVDPRKLVASVQIKQPAVN